jgi:hypothetical protein
LTPSLRGVGGVLPTLSDEAGKDGAPDGWLGDGLEGGDGGLLWGFLCPLLLLLFPLLREDFFEVFLAFEALVEVGWWGEGAELGVFDDLFDGVGGVDGELLGREVEGGDLEAVEEEACAAGIELVGGEAEQDLADGGLDGAAVLGRGEGEGGAAAAGLFGGLVTLGCGLAGVVVVEAEVLLAERGRAAAMAAGEDVTALEAWLHWCFG